jgi:hypothetical protein
MVRSRCLEPPTSSAGIAEPPAPAVERWWERTAVRVDPARSVDHPTQSDGHRPFRRAALRRFGRPSMRAGARGDQPGLGTRWPFGRWVHTQPRRHVDLARRCDLWDLVSSRRRVPRRLLLPDGVPQVHFSRVWTSAAITTSPRSPHHCGRPSSSVMDARPRDQCQRFRVPTGATRLYLGFTDAWSSGTSLASTTTTSGRARSRCGSAERSVAPQDRGRRARITAWPPTSNGSRSPITQTHSRTLPAQWCHVPLVRVVQRG